MKFFSNLRETLSETIQSVVSTILESAKSYQQLSLAVWKIWEQKFNPMPPGMTLDSEPNLGQL